MPQRSKKTYLNWVVRSDVFAIRYEKQEGRKLTRVNVFENNRGLIARMTVNEWEKWKELATPEEIEEHIDHYVTFGEMKE